MSNTFSIRRFMLLFKKTIMEKPWQMLGFIILLLALVIIAYVTLKKIWDFSAAQNLCFCWGLSIGSFFIASFVFGNFNNNANGSSYLLLPVSYFEKWLCGILIAGILYPLIFLIFFHVMDIAFVAAYHNSLDPTSPSYKQQYESIFTFDLNGNVAWKIYPIFFILTGGSFTGALYFNKIPIIKTAIALCALFLILYGFNWLIANILFDNVDEAGLYDHVSLAIGKETGTLLLPSKLESFLHYALSYVMPAILWFLPLLRLREKEF